MVNNLTLEKISSRLSAAGCRSSKEDSLAIFVDLMAKWNRKINLTSLEIDPVTDESIDRLIVEPVVAASMVGAHERAVVDLGSGGGSPAIPFRIQLDGSQMTMVESRSRKCAFLREAVRTIGLDRTYVEESRFEEIHTKSQLRSAADLVTVRAVRMDEDLVGLIRLLLKPGGRVFRFVGAEDTEFPQSLQAISTTHLAPSLSSSLQILTFR